MSTDSPRSIKPAAPALRSAALVVINASEAAAPEPLYWRSIEERAGEVVPDPQAHRDDHPVGQRTPEFPDGADVLDGVSRRNFVQLLGTTLAVGGTACYRPRQKIVPYVRRPAEVTPGNPLHFASAYALEGYGTGILVESHAGRPTKVEGNPDHPDSLGATGLYEQALTLGLYDDDRAKSLHHKGAVWPGASF